MLADGIAKYMMADVIAKHVMADVFAICGRCKESMFIRVNGPFLNKNIGKYHLPHLWDEVLNNSRELKLK